jgi:hypothetical protein
MVRFRSQSLRNGNPFPVMSGTNAPFVPFGTFVAQQADAKGPTTYT